MGSAVEVKPNTELAVSTFHTDTVQERRNITEYTTENVTLENGTTIENRTVDGWHWETGGNTYLFEVAGVWTESTSESKTDVTVELAPNNLTKLLVANKAPWKDIADGQHDAYDGRVDYFNQHYYFNGSDITQSQMDDLVVELDSIPVALDGEEQKTMTVKEKSKNVTVKVRSNMSQRIKIGSHSTVVATSGGTDDTYDAYKPLNATSVSGTPSLEEFPAYLSVNSTDIDWTNIDGAEDVDITNRTNHRVPFYFKSFDATEQEAEIWFRADLIRDGTEQLRLHYGNGGTDESSDPATVYDAVSDLPASYDFSQDSSPLRDRTSNNNDETNSVGPSSRTSSGVFGQAYDFDGSDDRIDIPGAFSGGSAISLVAAVDIDTLDGSLRAITGTGGGYRLYIDNGGGNGEGAVALYSGNNAGWMVSTSTNAISTGEHTVAATYNGSTARIYIDGSEAASASVTESADAPEHIGVHSDSQGHYYDGRFSDLSIYSADVGGDWVQAYHDMSSVGGETLLTLGGEQTGGDTTPPSITIHHPTNSTFASSTLDLNVTADEPVDYWQYSVDGAVNTTFSPNTTLSGLSDGQRHLQVFANDTSGNTNSSSVTFTVDTTGPNITIHQPPSGKVEDSTPDLQVTADEAVDTWIYNLDSTSNVTFTPNTTFNELEDGDHTVTVYANDSLGNAASESVTFDVDTTAVDGGESSSSPPEEGEDEDPVVPGVNETRTVIGNIVMLLENNGFIKQAQLCLGPDVSVDHYLNKEPCPAQNVVDATLPTRLGSIVLLVFGFLYYVSRPRG